MSRIQFAGLGLKPGWSEPLGGLGSGHRTREIPLEVSGVCCETLGVSIGVDFYPRDGRDAESLLEAADAALYHR